MAGLTISRDIVFVKSENFKRANMIHMADQVAEYNQKFKNEKTALLAARARAGGVLQTGGLASRQSGIRYPRHV